MLYDIIVILLFMHSSSQKEKKALYGIIHHESFLFWLKVLSLDALIWKQ